MNRRSFFSALAIGLLSAPAIAKVLAASRPLLWFDGVNDYLKPAPFKCEFTIETKQYKLRSLSGVSGNYASTPDTNWSEIAGDANAEWWCDGQTLRRLT